MTTNKIRTAEEHLAHLRSQLARLLHKGWPLNDPEIRSYVAVIRGYVGNGIESPVELTPEQVIRRIMSALGIGPEWYRTSGWMERREGRKVKVGIRLTTWTPEAEQKIAALVEEIRETTAALGHEYLVRVDWTRTNQPLTYVHHKL